MTTTTTTFDPDLGAMVWNIYNNRGEMTPDPYPEVSKSGPVDGVWTITAPDDITQAEMDEQFAAQLSSIMIIQNMTILFERVSAGIQPNRDFLAIESPTVEQNDTQIQALTRQINALLILRSGDFSDISGT
jgi:hypothetical protein